MKIYTIYARPHDYPDCFVLRAFEISANSIIATDEVKMASSLSEIRALIPPECVCMGRQSEDDSVIVETWL